MNRMFGFELMAPGVDSNSSTSSARTGDPIVSVISIPTIAQAECFWHIFMCHYLYISRSVT